MNREESDMHVTKNEFLVLRAMVEGEDITEELGPKALARTKKLLWERECLDAEGNMTDFGRETLEQYRVKNAIFQAAGLCSRFAPVSYDTPKGLVELRGEVLLERQIRQLHEKGITDITVCTGHLADRFDYLADKYGVELIHNPEFAHFNSISTVYHARHKIDATYLLYCDHYYFENPFHAYEYKSFYPTQYDTHTSEWREIIDEDYNIVSFVQSKDGAGIHLQGICFISHKMAPVLIPILEQCFHDPDLKNRYFEHAFWMGMGTLHVCIETLPHGICNEFDSVEDMLEFDPAFLEKVHSPSLDNICRELGCTRYDLHDIHPIDTDPAHASCRFTVDGKEYVFNCVIGDDFAMKSWSLAPME